MFLGQKRTLEKWKHESKKGNFNIMAQNKVEKISQKVKQKDK